MLHFSVPLAADIDRRNPRRRRYTNRDGNRGPTPTVTGMAENEDNDGNGTITIDPGDMRSGKSAHPRRDVGCQRRRWSRYRDS